MSTIANAWAERGENVILISFDSADNDFYELRCVGCNAKLVFGQHKKGETIFPKRHWNSLSDKEKEQRGPEPKNGYLSNNGWFKWQKP